MKFFLSFAAHKYLTYLIFILSFSLFQTAYSQANDDCLMCHSDKDLSMEKRGRTVSLFVDENVLQRSVHSKLNCVACHIGFSAFDLPHKENITPINCLTCHKDSQTKHLFHPRILRASGTDGTKDVSCKGCHGTHEVTSVHSPANKWHASNLETSCGSCHKEISEKYLMSSHRKGFVEGVRGAPNCITCHRQPIAKVNGETDSLQLKTAQEKLCLSCHLDDPEIRRRTTPSAGFIQAYDNSVHGRSLHGGNSNAASCVDCHKSHDVIIGSDSRSSVFRLNVQSTCGSCHSEIEKEFNESIHGQSLIRGNLDSPSCTHCHGEHNILDHFDPDSPVAFQNVSLQICSPCHESVRLSERFGLAANRYATFRDSYHGLALSGGQATVANCGSCHGVHNIKPSTDPTSMIHRDNLVETCGSCHPGANEVFTTGTIHVTLDREDEPLLFWISYIYIMMIVSIIGGMFFHNIVDLYRKYKIKQLKALGKIPEERHGHALYLRMSVNERIQHGTMALSFIVLVITGFMLRYPDSWWVRHITDISSDAFIYRSLIHRIAAIVMVAVCLYHIYYISFTQRGRQLLKDLLPKLQDFRDAIGVAKFNLGLIKEKPLLDRFSYVEKAEYWALVWGTIIMTVTGLLMWIYIDVAGSFTKFEWDIARTIHYYEAWLAFLAIVVWHFYFVIFNPDVYPMNIAWLKGKIPEEQMAEEHPLELKRIKSEQYKARAEKDSEQEDEHPPEKD